MEAIKSPVRTLLAAQGTSAVGDGCFYVTSALFLTQVVRLSPALTGVYLSVAWATGFVLSAPLGRLADRVGLRRAAVALSLVVASALLLASVVQQRAVFLVVLTAYAVAQSGLVSARQALVAVAVPAAERVTVRARLHVVMNAGIGLGSVLGGVALAVGTVSAYRSVLWADALLFAGAAWLTTRMPVTGSAPDPTAPRIRGGVLRDRPYVVAALLASVLYLYMPMLSVVLPVHLARRTEAPAWAIAAVFVVNTVGVMALQVRAARRVSSVSTAAVSVRRGGAVLGLSCLVFAAAALPSSWPMALGVALAGSAVQVVGEVLMGSGAWHLGFALADPDRPGEWQGLFTSGLPLARSLGPVVLSALVLTWSGPGWVVLAAIFAVAGLALARVGGWADGVRQRATCSSAPASAGIRLTSRSTTWSAAIGRASQKPWTVSQPRSSSR